MPDPRAQASAQLTRILTTLGRDVPAVAREAKGAGLEKHGQLLKHFKAAHGLGHGDANALAHAVREHLAGGPAKSEDLLDAQYAGRKAGLRPIYEALHALAAGQGQDVEVVIQKTGVSFRRQKQFALVQAPSAARVQLGLNLAGTPDDPRVVAMKGMCSHKMDLTAVEQVDEDVASWIQAAYSRAG